jgi:glycosyltransferase involved in cell wall biosynthesis
MTTNQQHQPAQPWKTGPIPWHSEVSGLATGSVPVTAIILALDEEANIARCLETLGWCDQTIMVDSGSTDATAAIAERHGAEVIDVSVDGFGPMRDRAMRDPRVRNDWVLFVDADEWISVELAEEIATLVGAPRDLGYALRVRLVFQGTWLHYGGWYGGALMVRLANKHHARWTGDVSEKLVVDGPVGLLEGDLVDQDFKRFERWLDRHNRYSTLKAIQRVEWGDRTVRDRWDEAMQASPRSRIPREVIKRVVAPVLPAPGFWRFLYMYVLRGGFLHGKIGLRFSLLHAMQEMHIQMKIDELRREPDK